MGVKQATRLRLRGGDVEDLEADGGEDFRVDGFGLCGPSDWTIDWKQTGFPKAHLSLGLL
jgi:hypothetical protein